MHHLKTTTLLALSLVTAALSAAEPLTDQAEVEALLKGAHFNGTYLRRNTHYAMHFKADGSLINQRNEEGKWWVNKQGQYCREWLTGRLKGNKACMSLARDGEQLLFISRGHKVAVGTLTKQQ